MARLHPEEVALMWEPGCRQGRRLSAGELLGMVESSACRLSEEEDHTCEAGLRCALQESQRCIRYPQARALFALALRREAV